MESTSAVSQSSNPPVKSLDTKNIPLNEANLSTHNVARVEKEESERQAWFQNAVNGAMDIPIGYLKVAVLIVRWHEDIDEYAEGHTTEVRI